MSVFTTPLGAKVQLSKTIEEMKQSKEELEVRMSALKSQYEGRLLRQDRELRELRGAQAQSDPREEPQDQSGAKVHMDRSREGHSSLHHFVSSKYREGFVL